MKLHRCLLAAFFVTLVSILSCASNFTHYHPSDEIPRMMYIGNEVDELIYTPDKAGDGRIYVEIRTRQGDLETGNLLQITQDEIFLTSGYMYSMVDETKVRTENQRVIRKDNVSIMKVW